MLYEVITDSLTGRGVTGRLAELRGDVERLFGGVHPPTVPDRITSYNVCYTKLLRGGHAGGSLQPPGAASGGYGTGRRKPQAAARGERRRLPAHKGVPAR